MHISNALLWLSCLKVVFSSTGSNTHHRRAAGPHLFSVIPEPTADPSHVEAHLNKLLGDENVSKQSTPNSIESFTVTTEDDTEIHEALSSIPDVKEVIDLDNEGKSEVPHRREKRATTRSKTSTTRPRKGKTGNPTGVQKPGAATGKGRTRKTTGKGRTGKTTGKGRTGKTTRKGRTGSNASGTQKPITWTVQVKDSANARGTATVKKLIHGMVKHPKNIMSYNDFEDLERTLGWGGLVLTDQDREVLVNNEFVSSVTEEKFRKKKMMAIPDGKVEKRTPKPFRVQDNAPEHLAALSMARNAPLNYHYVYEGHAGRRSDNNGIYIYVVDEGVQENVENIDQTADGPVNLGREFPYIDRTLYTQTVIEQGYDRPTDGDGGLGADSDSDGEDQVEPGQLPWDKTSHGTKVASLALGAMNGVAKHAILVPVKCWPRNMLDLYNGLTVALGDIRLNNRQSNSIVILAAGTNLPSDPQASVNRNHPAYNPLIENFGGVIGRLFTEGVPVVVPAGNDGLVPGRQHVDFAPSYWGSRDFPLIVVGELDETRQKSPKSQDGPQVTTWVMSGELQVTPRTGVLSRAAGTSMGCGIVAGQIAVWDSYDDAERPWAGLTGIPRVTAIYDFVKSSPASGWSYPDATAAEKRIMWNGLTRTQYRANTVGMTAPVGQQKRSNPGVSLKHSSKKRTTAGISANHQAKKTRLGRKSRAKRTPRHTTEKRRAIKRGQATREL
ncbi:subtilisin-like protein [Amniculicola lignicola CBS 123094]|uniref:Subtilisin-like protein n=1 Tax=Amniculicola lignicola CBS 123094 TaxID=1392246 RepID=A0A6A5WNL7_9PLEO|nr:subtilisin-like protein [Amniculicola lignicola CBS 123094]